VKALILKKRPKTFVSITKSALKWRFHHGHEISWFETFNDILTYALVHGYLPWILLYKKAAEAESPDF